MSDFKLEFTLRQHTPLIHFQHDQAGATLRATEVKAKLDQFIWNKAWGNSFEKGKFFLVGYSADQSKELKSRFESSRFRALDYKISFVAHSNETSPVPARMPLYFGNMGSEADGKKDKHLVSAQGGVTGKIICLNPALLAILEQQLPAFFQVENFGTRQTKGFGSFQLTHFDDSTVAFAKPSAYSFQITTSADLNVLWEHIDLFYRTLRSGINLKGAGQSDKLYFKSLMFQYAKTQQHQWDKRKIRLDLFEYHPKLREVEQHRQDSEGTVKYNKGTPMLYRDMLGLSSEQSWLSYKAKVTKTSKNGAIDRFKSPITFKPFQSPKGWDVYIIPQAIPAEMKNTAFVIESGGKQTTLFTPEFNLDQYLKFAFGYFNEANSVEDYLGDHVAPREARIIENIYNQLRKFVTP